MKNMELIIAILANEHENVYSYGTTKYYVLKEKLEMRPSGDNSISCEWFWKLLNASILQSYQR